MENDYMYNYQDYGPEPVVIDIEGIAEENVNFRTTIWTGEFLQLTLMSIPVGGEIGQELHTDFDQFLYVVDGNGVAKMGNAENALNMEANLQEGNAFIIPAGKWHNVLNSGPNPLKLYSLYAPPAHPKGTIHRTKAESDADE